MGEPDNTPPCAAHTPATASAPPPPAGSGSRGNASPANEKEAAPSAPTPLHIALWNGNLNQIRECIKSENDVLEARDRRGNRALHLALKFAHRNSVAIVKCLLDAGARVRSRDTSGWKTVHHAIAAENEEILRILVQREKEQAPGLLAKKIETICPQLAQAPNFYSEIHVDISTWIPGMSRWLPSDTVKIWKRDNDIRFDISLVGFENGSWKRGKLSFLLLGDDVSFLCLDHEDQACMNLLSAGQPLEAVEVDAMVHFLMTTSIITSDFNVANVVFHKKHRWLSSADLVQDIGPWKNTHVYDMTGVEASLRIRKPQNKSRKPPKSALDATPENDLTSTDAFSVLTDAFKDDDQYTEVVVDSSAEHVVSTELHEGEVVTWKFSTERYDIGFGVKFLKEEGDDDDWEDAVTLQRCASHEQEQSGSFQAPSTGTVMFTWDNTFSRVRSKTVRFLIQTQASNDNDYNDKEMDSQGHHRAREEAMTFEDWFGVRIVDLPAGLQVLKPKRQIMVHAQPNCRQVSKSFPATVHMSDDFPMSMHEFLPVIEVLSKTTRAFENVKEFFEAQTIDGFPVQFCFPLIPSISATFRFDTMELCTPEASLFEIPKNYTRHEEDVLSPRKRQALMKRVAAVFENATPDPSGLGRKKRKAKAKAKARKDDAERSSSTTSSSSTISSSSMSYSGSGGGGGYDRSRGSGSGSGGYDSRGSGGDRGGYDDPNRASGGSGGGYNSRSSAYDSRGGSSSGSGYSDYRGGGYDQRATYDSRGGYGDYPSSSGGGSTGYGDARSSSSGYSAGYDSRGGYDSRSGYSSQSAGYSDSRSGDYPRSSSSGYGTSSGYNDRSRDYTRSSSGGYGGYDDRAREYQRSSSGGYAGSSHGGSEYGDRGYSSSSYTPSSSGYDDRGSYSRSAPRDDKGYAGSHGSSHGSSGGYGDRDRGSGYGGDSRSSGTRDDRGYGGGGRADDRGYGGGGSRGDDRGYGGGGRSDDRGYSARDEKREDRGYGGSRGDDRGGRGGSGYGGRGGGGFGGGRGGGGGFGGGRGGGPTSAGAGDIRGTGYENIGEPIADPRLEEEWSGRLPPRDVDGNHKEINKSFLICRRPNVAVHSKSIQMSVNYFGLSVDPKMSEIFKYHVAVELTPRTDAKYGPSGGADQKDVSMAGDEPKEGDVEMSDISEPKPTQPERPERPLRKPLVRMVINAVLQQYEAEFGGVRVVHDGMAAVYSPQRLPWDTKDFEEVNPDGPVDRNPQRKGRGPRTFSVKLKYVETINMQDLFEYYTNPDVNPLPVLQALDVAARHLGAQRLIPIGRNFFSMKKTHPLRGGKELCWGYHQSIRVGQQKLLLNMDQAATVFYAPGPLLDLVTAALNVREARDVRQLSERESRSLSRALRKIEVITTHRVADRKKPIFGISSQPVDATMVEIDGKEVSVADYFSQRYKVNLRYANLPAVNIGSTRRPTWLPIEVCEVAPGQRCANINDLDTAEIIKQTSQKPHIRADNIMEQVRSAGFENDPYLSSFGMKVDPRMETLEAKVLETPEVQYANISERPNMGAWNLRDRRFVDGAVLSNWGVVVHANIRENDVQRFVGTLADVARKCGMEVKDQNPIITHQDAYRGAQVEDLMQTCFKELEHRNMGPPQLIVVIKKDKTVGPYSDIKRMSDTVLGIPSQCLVAANVQKGQVQYCANVCLKINMKLSGKNSILREHLPLVSSTPAIVIGANISHPRSGMGSRPSIASVVASLDRYSAKYVARVAAQKASNDISTLPYMLRDLFLAYYQTTHRKPEHIIYYRDGVSEGQFYDILQTEMKALRTACMMMSEDFMPPVTFIVVNKRHHMRGFSQNRNDCDRSGNIQPGTVIDTGIVDVHRFDFFLYGHSGIQGTSCPAHYTVLHDENKMSAEDVQKLTYNLCYTFARCTRSVSVVPPVYYAQLAATRARFFLNEGSDGASTVGSGRSNSSNYDFTDLHKNLLNCMFYI